MLVASSFLYKIDKIPISTDGFNSAPYTEIQM